MKGSSCHLEYCGLTWILSVFITFMLGCVVLATAQQMNNNLCVGRMDGIVFPDARSCIEFFQCHGGVMMRQQCPPGTLFDLNLYYCSVEHAVDCGLRTKPVTVRLPNSPDAPPSSESHHSVCRGQTNGALFANPSNCRAYIECQQNLRLDRECTSGELFEAQSGVCLSEFSVDCGNRDITPQIDDQAARNVCQSQQNGALVANPRDCRRYFECRNNLAVTRECSTGDLFETSLQRCVHNSAVNCAGRGNLNIRPVAPPSTDSNTASKNLCRTMPTGTRISNPQDCRSYFECRNSERIEITCPVNQSFDVQRAQCSASNLVNCGNRRNIVSQSQQNAICQGQRDGIRLANQNNCRAWIECQGNTRVERECENGHLFDTQLKNCLPAHTVRCGSRGLPPADSSIRSPEDFFPPCPFNGVTFRSHPHDCQRYFICAEGSLIQHSCANGIYFNPDSFQCDFPHNVQCRLNQIVVPQTPLLPDCSYGESHFPNLTNCKQYYKCVKNEPKLMNCPTGQLWNNQKMQCEKSDTSSCARSFNGQSYQYTAPREDEQKG